MTTLKPYDSPRVQKHSLNKGRGGFHDRPSGLFLKLKNSSLMHNSSVTRRKTSVAPVGHGRMATIAVSEAINLNPKEASPYLRLMRGSTEIQAE